MTSKERLLAVIDGKDVDRRPTLSWPVDDSQADIQVSAAAATHEGSFATLALIPNLFRRFELEGQDPIAMMKDTAQASIDKVDVTEQQSLREAKGAIERGALGVLYEVHGADATRCTPMEYGGLFLERDRAFLEAIADAPCNFVYINGKEPYLDFVADLPAHVFAWDAEGSGISVSEVRAMRSGLLAAPDEMADIPLAANGSLTDLLRGVVAHV